MAPPLGILDLNLVGVRLEMDSIFDWAMSLDLLEGMSHRLWQQGGCGLGFGSSLNVFSPLFVVVMGFGFEVL